MEKLVLISYTLQLTNKQQFTRWRFISRLWCSNF